MKILIIGAGAIGSLVGAKLAQQGANVTLVGRPAFAQLVKSRGLRLEDEAGAHQIENIVAADSVVAAFAQAERAFDLAIVTVKSYDTGAALEECAAAAAAGRCSLPPMLSLQNGVGNEEIVAAVVGPERTIAGTITTPVSLPAPGVIQVERPQYVIGLSDWQPHGEAQPVNREIEHQLDSAGFTVTRYANAQGMKWTKLLMNMTANAASAILGMTPEALFGVDEVADLEIAAWREALAVMQKAGIPPQNLGGYPFRALAPAIRYAPHALLRPILRKRIGSARGGKLPSLYLDLESGKKKSEVTWLNGAIADLGATQGVATPVNQLLTETLLRLVAHPEERPGWRGNYARLVAEIEE